MDDSRHQELVLLGGLFGSVVTAFFTGLTMVLRAWWKARGERQTTQFSEQSRIIDRQEKQIARLEAQVKEQQETIEELRKIVAMLREDMIRAGLNPGGTDADFMARQTEQSTKLLTSVDEHLKQEPPGGGHADAHH